MKHILLNFLMMAMIGNAGFTNQNSEKPKENPGIEEKEGDLSDGEIKNSENEDKKEEVKENSK